MANPYFTGAQAISYVHGVSASPFVQAPGASARPFAPGVPVAIYTPDPSMVYTQGLPGTPFPPGAPGMSQMTYNGIPVMPQPANPMPRPAAARTAIYSLIIVFGLTANAIGPLALIIAGFETITTTLSTAGMAFAGIATGCSLFTWIWASVLLSYNRRFYSIRTMTRAHAHCISTMVLGIVWLIISIMIFAYVGAGNSRSEPYYYYYGPEPFALSLGCLSLSLSILLGSVALYIYLRASKRGAKMSQVNVAQFDGDMPQMQMQIPVVMQTRYHQEEKPLPVQPTTAPLSSVPNQAAPTVPRIIV